MTAVADRGRRPHVAASVGRDERGGEHSERRRPGLAARIQASGLTLSLLAIFAISLVAQVASGRANYNETLNDHGQPPVGLAAYLTSGHFWEATLENWESEFLEMAAFVMLTVVLVQKGSPESRRPYAVEESDVDPKRFAHRPDAPWPVRRGGWVLAIYQYSLGLTLALLFVLAWSGQAVSGWHQTQVENRLEGKVGPEFLAYIGSSRFWFHTVQNWQSEFLGIAAMVWLAVYLRHRGSPESKPVHAAHDETGR